MGLYDLNLSKKPKALGVLSTSETKPDAPDRLKSTNTDDEPAIEELDMHDKVLHTQVESGDVYLFAEASSSINDQIKGLTSSTGWVTNALPSSAPELFGGDDTDFLKDLLRDSPVISVSKQSVREDSKNGISLDINQSGCEDGANDGIVSEEDEAPPEGRISLRPPPVSHLLSQQTPKPSSRQGPTASDSFEPTDVSSDEYGVVDKNENREHLEPGEAQVLSAREHITVVDTPSASVHPLRLRKPIGARSLDWADMDDDVDDWAVPIAWTADQNVLQNDLSSLQKSKEYYDSEEKTESHATADPIDETSLQETERGSLSPEARISPSCFTSLESRVGAGRASLDDNEDAFYPKQSPVGKTPTDDGDDLQGSEVRVVSFSCPPSESEYGAGYTGPSRSLAIYNYSEVEQAYRFEEQRRDVEEAYLIQMQQLWNQHAADIQSLEEPSTIGPEEEDLHDEQMRNVFIDIYPALPSQSASGQMHIIDWKTLSGPGHMGLDPDEEERYLLNFVKPRLCDVVATLLFESDPSALEVWLDPSKKIVEWHHIPHYLHRRILKTVIRRDGNDVIVGTFTDLGFNVCWSRYIKAVIADNGQWSETFTFSGGQFKKEPGAKEPGASSRKIGGEIDWKSFEIGDPKWYDADELWDPVEALWHGRLLAHTLLGTILNNYAQYRGGKTVELIVDGNLTTIEERGVRCVRRCNGVENDRVEQVISSPGALSRVEEDVSVIRVSSNTDNDVER